VAEMHTGLSPGQSPDSKPLIPRPILVYQQTVLGFESFQRPVVIRPKPFDLDTFQEKSHELGGTYFKIYCVYMPQEVLSLGIGIMTGKVRCHTPAQIYRLAHVDNLPGIVTEIVHPRRMRQ